MEDLVEVLQPQAIEEEMKISAFKLVKEKPKPRNRPTEKGEAKIGFENVETVMSTNYLLKGFGFVGIYKPKIRKTFLIVNMFINIYVPIGFAITFLTMSENKVEMDRMMTSVQSALNSLGCSAKFIMMSFLLSKLLNCEHIFKKLDKRCSSQEELMSIKTLIKNGNRYVLLFTILYWTWTSTACVVGGIFHQLPYNIHNPLIDAKASNYHFYLALFMEFLVAKVICFQQVLDDSYAVIYINILRAHLDILMKRISKLNYNTEQSLEANLEELKLCIIDHKNLIEIYNRIFPVISATNFVQFAITAIVLSTTLVNITLFAANIASVFTSCLYAFVVVAEIFPLCYYAQCLMDESDRLPDVIFHSNWVDQNRSYRKLLIFFLQRSQRTFKFTAGKLFPITLACFLSIAKFSFSLYTFIEGMGIKEKLAK